MDWKNSKALGIVAFLLILASGAALVMFARSQRIKGPQEYFICADTEEVFSVEASVDNRDYVDNYSILLVATAGPCKICGKKDAYRAIKHRSGKWIIHDMGYFQCESTGEVFLVPTEFEIEGYQAAYFENPGEACHCRICGKTDAYMMELDSEGKWQRRQPLQAPEAPAEQEQTEEIEEIEAVGWDAIIEKKVRRNASAGQTTETPAQEEPQAADTDESPEGGTDSAETAPQEP